MVVGFSAALNFDMGTHAIQVRLKCLGTLVVIHNSSLKPWDHQLDCAWNGNRSIEVKIT